MALCYLLGNITAGYYWVRWRTGLDLRRIGSGSVGARNAGRVAGASGFLITLLCDVAKGALAVWLANYFALSPEGTVACILAVVVGHNWPLPLRFHGGKGVATSLGALLAFDPWATLVLFVVFLPLWALVRSFVLSGLLAFGITPLVLFFMGFGNPVIAAISFLALLMLLTHRKNIREEIAHIWFHRAAKESPNDKGPPSLGNFGGQDKS